MTFFEFKPGDIFSNVYTTYPSRSFSFPKGVIKEYVINLYNSSSNNVGQGQRSFEDAAGTPHLQNYYISGTIKFYSSLALSSSQRKSVNGLRNIYASASFKKPQNYESSSYSDNPNVCNILSIPSFIIGSGIKPSSFSFDSPGVGRMVDDGYGGIYGDGQILGASTLYGCIFYEYGIAYFMDSADFDAMFIVDGTTQLDFSSTNHVPMNVYLCNSSKGLLNFSTNPSYTILSGTKEEITTESPQTFITTIGLYDEEFELMAVAKVSSAIRNKESDGTQFRLKFSF